MPTTVEVRFKGTRKDFFLWPDDAPPLRLQDPVIVESDRGLDLGRISATGDTAQAKCASACSGCAVGETPAPARKVLRLATQEEIRTANELRVGEEPVRQQIIERIRAHGLEMKAADTEWQWDRKKLTVYFTAEKRVDFRDLVRDLATRFKARIELRQIGVRDEAARLGGVGRCGKEYCCSSWLPELSPVSLSLAKDQHLSLNPAQISGGCGRLLCCLKYEHEFYVASRKRFPKEGKSLRTLRGAEKVVAVDIFREPVFLRHDEEGTRIVALLDLTAELEQAVGMPLVEPTARPPARERRERPSGPSNRRPLRDERPATPVGPAPEAPPPQPPVAATPPSSAPPAAPAPDRPGANPDGGNRKRRRRRRPPRRDGGGSPPSGA
jgi:cell fate regulator YaaT (PSP1 superfamily)